MAFVPSPEQVARMQAEVVDEPNQLEQITATITAVTDKRDVDLEADSISQGFMEAHLSDLLGHIDSPVFTYPLRLAHPQSDIEILNSSVPGTTDILVLSYLPYDGGADLTLMQGATPCTFTLVGRTVSNIAPAPPALPGASYIAAYTPQVVLEKSFDAGREPFPVTIPSPDAGTGSAPDITQVLDDITNWRMGATEDIIAPYIVSLSMRVYGDPDSDSIIEDSKVGYMMYQGIRETLQDGTRLLVSGTNWAINQFGDKSPMIVSRNNSYKDIIGSPPY